MLTCISAFKLTTAMSFTEDKLSEPMSQTPTFYECWKRLMRQILREHDLTKFTLFPDLPSELRIKIWALAQPGPRIIKVMKNELMYGGVSSATSPPVLLHVCRESRYETLKVFSLLLEGSTTFALHPVEDDVPQSIYVNPKIDTVFISDDYVARCDRVFLGPMIDKFNIDVMIKLKNLAAGYDMLMDNCYSEDAEGFVPLLQLRNLELLTVVARGKQCGRREIIFGDVYGIGSQPSPPLSVHRYSPLLGIVGRIFAGVTAVETDINSMMYCHSTLAIIDSPFSRMY